MVDNPSLQSADDSKTNATRRTFLKRLGIGVAGSAVVGTAGVAVGSALTGPPKPLTFEQEESDPTKAFDHVVVVMFENRFARLSLRGLKLACARQRPNDAPVRRALEVRRGRSRHQPNPHQSH